MPRIHISVAQQKIARQLIRRLDAQSQKAFFISRATREMRFPVDDPNNPTPTTLSRDDLDALVAAKLLKAGEPTGSAEVVQLSGTAKSSMLQNFGWRKTEIVMRAIFELAKGDREAGSTAQEIADYSGLALADVIACGKALKLENQVIGTNAVPAALEGSEPAYRLALTIHAWVRAEDPVHDAVPAQTWNIHNSNVGAVSTGPNSQNIVTQNIGTGNELNAHILSLITDLIAGLKRELPAEFESVRQDMEDIRKEFESGKPDPAKATVATRGFLRQAASWIDFGITGADKTNKVVTFIHTVSPFLDSMAKWAQQAAS